MAKKIELPKSFTFETRSFGGGGAAKYPYDQWFNGEAWLISKGEDYPGKTAYMPYKLTLAALKRGKHVDISRVGPNGESLKDALLIKARPLTEEEKLHAKERLAALKAQAATRKARKAAENGEDKDEDEDADEPAAQPAPAPGKPAKGKGKK